MSMGTNLLASTPTITAPPIAASGAAKSTPSWMSTPAQRKIAADHAARDFEATFVTTMLESMSAGVKTNKIFGGGQGEEMYRSLLNQEYGKTMAQSGSLHIADKIRAEMLRLQENHR